MSQPTVTPTASQQPATPGVSHQTARLLTAGIVAGPLFLALWVLQAFIRDGFDPGRHPISLLSLGHLGWIQIANFVVTGALFVACAVGLRRVLHPGPGGTWDPAGRRPRGWIDRGRGLRHRRRCRLPRRSRVNRPSCWAPRSAAGPR